MDEDAQQFFPWTENQDYLKNITCNPKYIPTAIEYFERLGPFGTIFVSIASLFTIFTVYIAADGTYRMALMKETKTLKRNVIIILFAYPVASVDSLVALSAPRTQTLSEATTQIYLAISFYYLYQLLLEVGHREIEESPSLKLRVGPCCCWPCLRFPSLEMNSTHLSWLKILVVQLAIVQALVFCSVAFMAAEDIEWVLRFGVVLQPISLISLCFAVYGLTVTTMSLKEVNPGMNLRKKTMVLQIILFFTRLQGWLIKALAKSGLFPCDSPITPQIYSDITFNALMIIEMLFLCYIARHVYVYAHEDMIVEAATQTQENHSPSTEINLRIERDDKCPEIMDSDRRTDRPGNENGNELGLSDPPCGGA